MRVYKQTIQGSSKQARIFLVSDGTITVRTFDPVPLEPQFLASMGLVPATQEQIDHAMNEVGTPFTVEWYAESTRKTLYPASMFDDFTGDPTATGFMWNSEVSWANDPNVLGVDALSERSTWLFGIDRLGPFFMNRTNMTLQFKTPLQYINMTERFGSMLTLIQPYTDTPLSECTYVMNVNDGAGYHHNFTGEILPLPLDGFVAFPTVRVYGPSTIAADGSATVNVEVIKPGTDEVDPAANVMLILDEIAGYAPLKRVDMVNGVGSFRVQALGMQVGETVKVKVNWRNWTNAALFQAAVV